MMFELQSENIRYIFLFQGYDKKKKEKINKLNEKGF